MKKILPKVLIPFSISILAVWFATRGVDWGKFRSIVSGAKISYIFMGFALSLATFWLRARRWKIMLAPFQDLPASTLMRWQIGGLFINNILPLRAGEFAR